MMNLLEKTRDLLRLYRFSPKKRLGQNFIVDCSLLQRMLSYASVRSDDVVLEVGAGFGFLTRLLAERCKRVIAVEVDKNLVRVLETQLNDLGNVELVEGDILKVSVPPFNKFVSIPPYSISSPMLFWLLGRQFDCAVLTFQKEFAERLTASVETKDYGRLTVTTYYFADTELLEHVPRKMFYPPPKVDSTVVRLKPKKPPFSLAHEETFFELVRVMFTQRNKKVRNAVIPFLHKRRIVGKEATKLADSLPFHYKRVWELAPEDFGALANKLSTKPI